MEAIVISSLIIYFGGGGYFLICIFYSTCWIFKNEECYPGTQILSSFSWGIFSQVIAIDQPLDGL